MKAWTTISASASATSYEATGLSDDTAYKFQIRSVNPAGISPASATATSSLPAKPAAPATLTASKAYLQATNNFQVSVAWTVSPADSSILSWEYRATSERQDLNSAGWTAIPGSKNNTRSYTIPFGVTGPGGYQFQVRAVNSSGKGAASATATVTLTPGKPASLTLSDTYVARTNDFNVTLTWAPPSPADPSITSWDWRAASGDTDTTETEWTTMLNAAEWRAVPSSDGDTRSYVRTSLANDVYRFQVRAANVASSAVDGGVPSDAVEIVLIPEMPDQFTANVVVDISNATLTWNNPNDPSITTYQYRTMEGSLVALAEDKAVLLKWADPNDSAITKWQYRQKSTGAYGSWTDIPDSTATTTQYRVTGLTNNTEYTFQARAFKPNDAMQVTLDAVGSWSLANIGSANQIALAWSDPQNARIIKWQYRQKSGTGSFGAWTDIAGSSATTTSYTATGLTVDTDYVFQVAPVIQDGLSYVLPLVVYKTWNFTTFSDTNHEETLSWTDPKDNTIVKYQYRTKAAADDWPATDPFGWTDISNSGDTTTSYTATCSPAGAFCDFEIRPVVHPALDEATATPPTNTGWKNVSSTVGTSAFDGSATASSSVTLTWSTPADTTHFLKWQYRMKESTATEYGAWVDICTAADDSTCVDKTSHQVDNLTSGTTYDFQVRAVFVRTSYTVTGLKKGMSYSFQLRAVNAAGNGEPTLNQLTTDNTALIRPAAPRNFAFTLPKWGMARFTWDDPVPADSVISRWEYLQAKGTGCDATDCDSFDFASATWTTISGGSGARGFTLTGLDPLSTYAFQLRAVNAAGESTAAGPAMVRTRGTVVSKSSIDNLEEGESTTYTVVLATHAPESDVVVRVVKTGDPDITVSPATLTFTPSNWDTAQTVTVTAGRNRDGSHGEVIMAHTAYSHDPGYHGIAINRVVVNPRPFVDAGNNRSEYSGDTVRLSGQANYPGVDTKPGLSLEYTWTQTGDNPPATVTINNASSLTATFLAPTVENAIVLHFELRVQTVGIHVEAGRYATDVVRIRVLPPPPTAAPAAQATPTPAPTPAPPPAATPEPEPEPTPLPTPTPTPEPPPEPTPTPTPLPLPTPGPSPTPTPTPTPLPEVSEGGDLVWPDSATVIETPDGRARLIIPAGAAPELLEVRMWTLDTGSLESEAPVADNLVNLAVEVNTYIAGTDILAPTTWLKGVELWFKLPENDQSACTDNRARVYRVEAEGWGRVRHDCAVDGSGNSWTVSVLTRFSVYALVVMPAPVDESATAVPVATAVSLPDVVDDIAASDYAPFVIAGAGLLLLALILFIILRRRRRARRATTTEETDA